MDELDEQFEPDEYTAYDEQFNRDIQANVLANRVVVTILTPSIESCMSFYLYLN